MKQGSELAQSALKTIESSSKKPSGTPQAANPSAMKNAQRSLVNDLFKVMKLRKPYQLTSMYRTPETLGEAKNEYMRQWTGITPTMVRNGIEKLRNRYPLSWLPDPVEFAEEFCRPQREDLGLPETGKAWLEACQHSHEPLEWQWTHPAVQLAGRKVGWKTLAGYSNEKQTRKEFEQAYETLVNRVLSGKPLEGEIHKGIEDQSSLNVFEQSNRHSEQQLLQTMEDQGIDPNAGRAAFLNMLGKAPAKG